MIEDGTPISLVGILELMKNAEDNDQGVTTREIAEMMGISIRKADDLIRRAMVQDYIKCKWTARKNRTGHIARRPAYFLTDKAVTLINNGGEL